MNVKIKLSDYLRPLLVGALLLGNATLVASASAEVRPLDRIVAIVDNDVIMQSQLDQRLREVEQTIEKRGAEMPPRDVMQQQVLERLITENLQLQIGERSGIRISDEELNQAMATIAQRNNMSLDQFRAALERDGLSLDTAREQIRTFAALYSRPAREADDWLEEAVEELLQWAAASAGAELA